MADYFFPHQSKIDWFVNPLRIVRHFTTIAQKPKMMIKKGKGTNLQIREAGITK